MEKSIIKCKICNEDLDLNSEEHSEAALYNKIHHECMCAYHDYSTGTSNYPTAEQRFFNDIFPGHEEEFQRGIRAFKRLRNNEVVFTFSKGYKDNIISHP